MSRHDVEAYEAHLKYLETGYNAYLLRTCLCLMPLANSLAHRFNLKSFDLDAAVNDCFSETYFSLKRGSATFNHSRQLWEYYYKKYLCVCKRYINRSVRPPLERNLELEDLCRVNYLFSRPRTIKDVEDKIFIEEELPVILRKEFKLRLRFTGQDRRCCIRMLESALVGNRIKVSRYHRFNTKHSTRLLRDYTRVLIRTILYKYYNKFVDSTFISEKMAVYYDNG